MVYMKKNAERTKKYFMNREGIGFFKSVLESYEDIAIFSVINEKRGLIELIYPLCFDFEIKAIMQDMLTYGITFQEIADV